MKKGDRVIRVSLRAGGSAIRAEGTIGELGTIQHVHIADDQETVFGYAVLWDAQPNIAQYVSSSRIGPAPEKEAP